MSQSVRSAIFTPSVKVLLHSAGFWTKPKRIAFAQIPIPLR